MKPILYALGYFALMVILYTVTTFIAIGLMSFAAVAITPGVFLATGGLTICLSIIAAVMSYHYWDIERDRFKLENANDQQYRMELLRIAEEEKLYGMEQRDIQVQVESPEYRPRETACFR